MSTSNLFGTIKPICIKILNNGKINDIKELNGKLQRIKLSQEAEDNPFNELVQYVTFPLIIKIKNLQKEERIMNEELEETLSCLAMLLENSKNLDWPFFKDIFFHVFLLMTASPETKKSKIVSEECKSVIMKVVIGLCDGLASKDIKQYLSPEFKAQLGHAVFVCLQMVETEKQISLRLLALRAVRSLGLEKQLDLSDEVSPLLASTFASFLPGIAMKLGRVATAGEIQNHKITVGAIHSWQYFVVLSLNDKTLNILIPNFDAVEPHELLRKGPLANEYFSVNDIRITKDENKTKRNENNKTKDISSVINKEWISTTKENLRLIVKSFSVLTSHPHWEVRRATGVMSFALSSRCVKSLDNILVMLLENLVILSRDSLAEVSTEAKLLTESLEAGFSDDTKDDINNAVMDRILLLIRKLPTVARFQDDDHILNIVQQLNASFSIKAHLNEITLDSVYLDKILLAFVTLLTLDSTEPELLQEHYALSDNIKILSLKPGIIRTFKYFRNLKIFKCICDMCEVICRSFSFIALIDSCIDLIQGNSPRRKEGFLLLMLFFEGAAKLKNYDIKEGQTSVMSAIDTIIDLRIFNAPITSYTEKVNHSEHLRPLDNKDSSISVENARSNVILLSYALQVVGKCSLLLGKDFTQFLNIVLYHLLEKAGETNNVVSNSAISALEEISHSCGFENLSQFIECSVPYFWYSLSLRLKKIPEYPSAPQVLRFTLVSHKIEMKTYIEELVEDILDSLDAHHIEMAVPLMTVLLTYTESLHVNSDKPFCKTMSNFLLPKDKEKKNIDGVVESLVNDVDSRKLFEDTLADRDFNNQPLTEEDFKVKDECEDAKEEEVIPKHITIVQSILERISFLLSIKDRQMQLICLQIVQSSLDVLHEWENQKLPIFHKLWKPLVFCIKGKDLVVMLKATEVSILMLVSSGDFLVPRYFKELLPHFMDLLSSQSSISLGKTRKSGFCLLPGYKLQVFLLEKLPVLLKSLELDVRACKKVLKIILRYLEKRQPYELVKLGVRCLEYFVDHNNYLTWYLLKKTRGLSIIRPISDKLNTITVHGSKKEDFHEDMNKIFEILNIF